MTASTLHRCGAAIIAVAAVLLGGCSEKPPVSQEKPKPNVSFHPQEVTDALHAVIAADRQVYSRDIVDRLHKMGAIESSKDWQQGRALPLHMDMLRLSAQAIQKNGAEFHFVLRSLDPVNKRNAPQTDVEARGLKAVQEKPASNFYSEEFLGGRRYFTAVYADKADFQTCVDCHNAKPDSRQHAVGDVMGGLVVRVPLEF